MRDDGGPPAAGRRDYFPLTGQVDCSARCLEILGLADGAAVSFEELDAMLPSRRSRRGARSAEIVTRELEDVACAHAEELADLVPSLAMGLGFGAAGAAR